MKRIFLFFALFIFSGLSFANIFEQNSTKSPLDVESAFQPSITLNSENLILEFNVQPKHYLYKDKLKLSINNEKIDYISPKSHNKLDPIYGNVQIFEGYTKITSELPKFIQKNIKLEVIYQGCSEEFNICYPEEKLVKEIINPNYNESNEKMSTETTVSTNEIDTTNIIVGFEDSNYILNLISNGSYLFTLSVFLLFGLMMAFTPCVFPMVPILSSIVVKHDKKHPLFVSFLYVLGISLCYASIGIILKLFNFNIQLILQNQYTLLLTAIVMVILSLSMFGIINFRLPNFIQQKIHNETEYLDKKDNPLYLVLSGYLSALMLSPCAVAPLAGTLLFASQYDSIIYSSLLLFTLGIGSGIPLMLWGTSFRKILPKTGKWMYEVKYIMGILILMVALYLLNKIIPLNDNDILTPALLNTAFIAVILAYLARFINIDFKSRFWLILILSIVVFNSNYVNNNYNDSISVKKEFIIINSMEELNANINGKTLLYVGADWCTSCKQMENTTFKNTEVISKLKEFKVLYLDITEISSSEKEILENFNLQIAPFYVLYNNKGIKDDKIYVGYLNKEKFLEILNKMN